MGFRPGLASTLLVLALLAPACGSEGGPVGTPGDGELDCVGDERILWHERFGVGSTVEEAAANVLGEWLQYGGELLAAGDVMVVVAGGRDVARTTPIPDGDGWLARSAMACTPRSSPSSNVDGEVDCGDDSRWSMQSVMDPDAVGEPTREAVVARLLGGYRSEHGGHVVQVDATTFSLVIDGREVVSFSTYEAPDGRGWFAGVIFLCGSYRDQREPVPGGNGADVAEMVERFGSTPYTDGSVDCGVASSHEVWLRDGDDSTGDAFWQNGADIGLRRYQEAYGGVRRAVADDRGSLTVNDLEVVVVRLRKAGADGDGWALEELQWCSGFEPLPLERPVAEPEIDAQTDCPSGGHMNQWLSYSTDSVGVQGFWQDAVVELLGSFKATYGGTIVESGPMRGSLVVDGREVVVAWLTDLGGGRGWVAEKYETCAGYGPLW